MNKKVIYWGVFIVVLFIAGSWIYNWGYNNGIAKGVRALS